MLRCSYVFIAFIYALHNLLRIYYSEIHDQTMRIINIDIIQTENLQILKLIRIVRMCVVCKLIGDHRHGPFSIR